MIKICKMCKTAQHFNDNDGDICNWCLEIDFVEENTTIEWFEYIRKQLCKQSMEERK